MEKKREPGFYWVKHKEDWKIAEYFEMQNLFYWNLCGKNKFYLDNEFSNIIEQQIIEP